ncbi:MAG: Tad domain-containing protein [Chloroflexota bacterium]|nr:Tad domain-containing protein [Chloroflexota bacterium]
MIGRPVKGQSILLVAVLLPLFFAIIGLVVDAGILFDERRELQNTADSAARAGAMEVDVAVYRRSKGARVVVNERRARAAVARNLAGRDIAYAEKIQTAGVEVRVQREVRLSFLTLLGFRSVTIGAVAVAEVRHGIRDANL